MSGLQPAHLGILFFVIVVVLTALFLLGHAAWKAIRNRKSSGR